MRREELSLVLGVVKKSLKPYLGRFPSNTRLPAQGRPRPEILAEIEAMKAEEQRVWHDGYVSGAVYHGDDEFVGFLSQVYALNAELNPLHPDVWPRATRFEAEVIAMTAAMLGADRSPTREQDGGVTGLITSGGTESILTAMRCARDQARAERGITEPELLMATSAHAAFSKAAQYYGMTAVRVPVDAQGRADVAAMRAAVTPRTAAIVGSAPSFPWGVIDPIEELSALAHERGIWFHTDGCLGGFLLPWAERLGEAVPPFDFRLAGVTSMSCDTHKYGYAAKGTSVVLFRNAHLRHYSYFTMTDWPGGLYNSPTMAGSRPGALSAEAWAAMLDMGEEGYLAATRRIVDTCRAIRGGIAAIPELRLLGDSLLVAAFTSDQFEPYALQDLLSARGWNLTGLQLPAGLHLGVTLRTAQPGVAERFLSDLGAAVTELRANPARGSLMAPIYGLGQRIDTEVSLADVLTGYLDVQYES
ncbi:MAG: aspartate aminotransferase family protein [Chloroflexota bacterium]|nr:aspartate aminotransferase family protein [Chloroflexota bacterium]